MPTDWSILLEWNGFELDGRADGHLGLGFDLALQAIRPDALDAAQLAELTRRASATETGLPCPVMPAAAEPYFRVWRLEAAPSCPLPPGFGVLLTTEGSGRLHACRTTIDVGPGVVVVIPANARCSLHGDVGAYLAQPPAPDAPDGEEWDT